MTPLDQSSAVSVESPPAGAGRYVGEWALFLDWCAHRPDPAARTPRHGWCVSGGVPGSAGDPRSAAYRHRRRPPWRRPPTAGPHRADPGSGPGSPRPARPGLVRPGPGRRRALRALPVHGWTGGWFGRRDRALLVLAATGLPYPTIAALTAGDVAITERAANVTAGGQLVEIAGGDDPTACRACALSTWIRALDLEVGRGARVLADALKKAHELTGSSPHRCAHLGGIDDLIRTATLLPPIDQHGFTPYAADLPLSPRSMSELARAAAAGRVIAHRAVLGSETEAAEEPPLEEPRTVPGRVFSEADWRRGVEARNRARTDLATLDGSLDDLDARIADLERRTRQLMDG